MTAKELAYSPCIIYCHGNAGNKVDIIEIFDFLLWDYNLCSFDFSGAGHSEGEFVTLGYFEKDDIRAVVDFLRKELNIQKIILYGRSMGAVSSLRYAEDDPNLKAIVLDSPFSNFIQLCEEILSNKFYMPSMVTKMLISSARTRILEKIENFDIVNFQPYLNAKGVQVPTIIIHGLQDSLVNIEHSRIIINHIHKNTFKKLLEVEGEHNDCRSAADTSTIRDFIMQFAYDAMVLKEHRRRLMLKNAHLDYTNKYGININSVITNFRNNIKENIKNSMKQEKRKMNNFNIHHSQVKSKKIKLKGNNSRDNSLLLSESIILGEIKDAVVNHTRSKSQSRGKTINEEKENFDLKSEPRRNNSFLHSNFKKKKAKANFKEKHNKDDEKITEPPVVITSSNSNNDMMLGLGMKYEEPQKDQFHYDDSSKVEFIFNLNNNLHSIQSQSLIVDDDKNPRNSLERSITLVKTSEGPLNDTQMQIDLLTNYSRSGTSSSSSKRIRNERLNHLGEIFGCEVRIKSDKISFLDVHKQSMKKVPSVLEHNDSTLANTTITTTMNESVSNESSVQK